MFFLVFFWFFVAPQHPPQQAPQQSTATTLRATPAQLNRFSRNACANAATDRSPFHIKQRLSVTEGVRNTLRNNPRQRGQAPQQQGSPTENMNCAFQKVNSMYEPVHGVGSPACIRRYPIHNAEITGVPRGPLKISPRPLASNRVDACHLHQTLQTSNIPQTVFVVSYRALKASPWARQENHWDPLSIFFAFCITFSKVLPAMSRR